MKENLLLYGFHYFAFYVCMCYVNPLIRYETLFLFEINRSRQQNVKEE